MNTSTKQQPTNAGYVKALLEESDANLKAEDNVVKMENALKATAIQATAKFDPLRTVVTTRELQIVKERRNLLQTQSDKMYEILTLSLLRYNELQSSIVALELAENIISGKPVNQIPVVTETTLLVGEVSNKAKPKRKPTSKIKTPNKPQPKESKNETRSNDNNNGGS
jgi:3-deoxy-D-manno-octulosonate 8-phosphate phosphatase KdsC-like HAD superfamily phosphatase